jgi:hypothetical protein
VDSGSKVTPINVKISVIFVIYFFSKMPRVPREGYREIEKFKVATDKKFSWFWGFSRVLRTMVLLVF